jgi:hypothetical protein
MRLQILLQLLFVLKIHIQHCPEDIDNITFKYDEYEFKKIDWVYVKSGESNEHFLGHLDILKYFQPF